MKTNLPVAGLFLFRTGGPECVARLRFPRRIWGKKIVNILAVKFRPYVTLRLLAAFFCFPRPSGLRSLYYYRTSSTQRTSQQPQNSCMRRPSRLHKERLNKKKQLHAPSLSFYGHIVRKIWFALAAPAFNANICPCYVILST